MYNVIYVTCEPDCQGSFDRRGSYRFCHLRAIHIGSVTDALSCEMFNPLTPNDFYSGRTAPLTSKVAFYIFFQQI